MHYLVELIFNNEVINYFSVISKSGKLEAFEKASRELNKNSSSAFWKRVTLELRGGSDFSECKICISKFGDPDRKYFFGTWNEFFEGLKADA